MLFSSQLKSCLLTVAVVAASVASKEWQSHDNHENVGTQTEFVAFGNTCYQKNWLCVQKSSFRTPYILGREVTFEPETFAKDKDIGVVGFDGAKKKIWDSFAIPRGTHVRVRCSRQDYLSITYNPDGNVTVTPPPNQAEGRTKVFIPKSTSHRQGSFMIKDGANKVIAVDCDDQ